ncbi:MAG: hypothetical protein PUD44_03160 [Clostridiaceae bacterium]|nr:hypothetical protein [Clostridiaceae bacterium]
MDGQRPAVAFDRPFGALPFLGTALAVLCWGNAAWTVADRFLTKLVSPTLGENLARYLDVKSLVTCILFSGGALICYLLAAKATESIADKGGFLIGAASAALTVLATALSYVLKDTLAVDALCRTLAAALLAAAFLLFAINRENSRDARSFSSIAAGFLLLRVFAYLANYYAVWLLETQAAGARLLAVSSGFFLFTNVVAYVFAGTAFLFMRTPVPAPQYPPKLKY